ncbi:MAG: hypothetical protein ACKVVT_13570 [Dehalococcoidia bacterium]
MSDKLSAQRPQGGPGRRNPFAPDAPGWLAAQAALKRLQEDPEARIWTREEVLTDWFGDDRALV